MAVITLLNPKGGVGKTSTCHHLAGALAAQGRRVLLVDNDPQACLTQGLLGPEILPLLVPDDTIAAAYAGTAIPGRLIRPTSVPGVDLVAGSPLHEDYNTTRPWECSPMEQGALSDLLGDVAGSYDWVLIDCPPNPYLASWAALLASESAIVPLKPEDYESAGIPSAQELVVAVVANGNPALRIAGYLLTMVQARRSIHKLYGERLRALYGEQVFNVRIPQAADFLEAIALRRPIEQHKPRSAAARAIRALADEIESRLACPAAGRGEAA